LIGAVLCLHFLFKKEEKDNSAKRKKESETHSAFINPISSINQKSLIELMVG